MKRRLQRTLRLPAERPRNTAPLQPLERLRPRGFEEWQALRRWGQLPTAEAARPGFLLRAAREQAGLSQTELAGRLGVSQQAVARAESWQSNPTIAVLAAWAAALGGELAAQILVPQPPSAAADSQGLA